MAASHGWEINSPIRQSFLGKVRWASHFALKTYLRWYQQRAAAHYLARSTIACCTISVLPDLKSNRLSAMAATAIGCGNNIVLPELS